MVDDLVAKYIDEYSYLTYDYKAKYPSLPSDTIESDFYLCLWSAMLKYHPNDGRFLEYLIILLDRQVKLSYNENAKWL